jgi:hypothetical protein
MPDLPVQAITKECFMSPISNVQAYSMNMSDQRLTSEAGLIELDQYLMVQVPLGDAYPVNGGPIVGEQYIVRYHDEAGLNHNDQGLRYLGIFDKRLVFTTAPA